MTRILKGLAFGAIAAAIAFLAAASARGQVVEAQTYDWRLVAMAQPADARKDIAIIEINEGSVRALEPAFGRWPWPRFVHGAVINYLARNHARMIVYDVLLSEPDFLGNYKV